MGDTAFKIWSNRQTKLYRDAVVSIANLMVGCDQTANEWEDVEKQLWMVP